MRVVQKDIVYEDNHLIAVSKPAGVLVQADRTGDQALSESVKEYIKKKYKKPGDVFLGTIHRLDRPVSGLVVFAKTSKALSRMNALFRDKEIQKTYFALCDRKPKKLAQKLVHWLTKDNYKNLARAHEKEVKESKRAELEYQYISSANHKNLLRVQPKTGRPHQIRVQLAKMGCPIHGDLKYGADRGRDTFIYLHAYSLAFIHPVKKEKLTLYCPLPNEVNWNFFRDSVGNS
jgi:23S rRNA pseudouridine1911/1915/1917 synthase